MNKSLVEGHLVARIFRSVVLPSTLLIPLSVFNTANAQDNAGGKAAPAIEEIIVRGVRLENQRAIDAKRNSENIVDAIATDDLANLPDFSVAEALRRVSGLSTTGRNGDAEFVTVRGLRSDLNYLTIDGASLPSTSNGRQAGNASRGTQLSIVPSSLVKRVDVVKSFTADMEGNVIGGAFDLKTRSAFDQDSRFLVASLSAGHYDHDVGPGGRVDPSVRGRLAYSESFGENNQFGVVVAGVYSTSEYYTYLPGAGFELYKGIDPIRGESFADARTGPEGTVLAPHGIQAYQYLVQRERKSIYTKFEYQPTDSIYMALSAYNFTEDDSEDRYDNIVFRFAGGNVDGRGDIPRDITETTGTAHRARVYTQYYEFGPTIDAKSLTYRLNVDIDERQKVSFLANIGSADNNEPITQRRFDSGTKNALAFDYDISGDYPSLQFAFPSYYQDASNQSADAGGTTFFREWENGNEQDQQEYKIGYEFQPTDVGFGYKAGISTRKDKREVDYFFRDYRPDSDDTRAFSLADALIRDSYSENLLNGIQLNYIDGAAFDNFFNATQDQWRLSRPDARVARDALSQDYSIEEEIFATYGELNWRGDFIYAYLAVRYEATDTNSSGYVEAFEQLSFESVDNNYEKVLPSFGINYDINDSTKLRFAYSETLGRPDYFSLRVNDFRRRDFSPSTDPDVEDDVGQITVTNGDPNLKPREAKNYDLSFEYYMDEIEGAFSVGLFYKELKNEIFNARSELIIDIDGERFNERTTTPTNAEGASLAGVEIGFRVGSLDFISDYLVDVSINANYAYIDSSLTVLMSDFFDVLDENGDTIPDPNNGGRPLQELRTEKRKLFGLERQPRNIYNLSVSYSPKPWSVTLAYKYRDRNLVNIQTATRSAWKEAFYDERAQLDFKFNYRWSKQLSFYAQARNLTNSSQDRILPALGDRIQWTRDYGQNYWAGATYKF